MEQQNLFIGVRRDVIFGSKAKENFVLAWLICLGGASFLTIGLATYLGQPVLFLLSQAPLTFYLRDWLWDFMAIFALFLGFYLWVVVWWGIGGGMNEFDCQRGRISVFRWGFQVSTDESISFLSVARNRSRANRESRWFVALFFGLS